MQGGECKQWSRVILAVGCDSEVYTMGDEGRSHEAPRLYPAKAEYVKTQIDWYTAASNGLEIVVPVGRARRLFYLAL